MKVGKIAKGGIYSLRNQFNTSTKGYYLVFAGGSELVPKVQCFRCTKEGYGKYAIPIVMPHGYISHIETNEIYSYPVDDFQDNNFIGGLTDNEFSTTQEMLELAFTLYQINIRMFKGDGSELLEDYMEFFNDHYASIIQKSAEKSKTKSMGFYQASMAGAVNSALKGSELKGPSELKEQMDQSKFPKEQEEFANKMRDKIAEDINPIPPTTTTSTKATSKTKLVSKKTKRIHEAVSYARYHYDNDDLHELMVEFKSQYSTTTPGKYPNTDSFLEDFLPMFQLAQENGRLYELAAVMGYKNINSLYILAKKAKDNNTAKAV